MNHEIIASPESRCPREILKQQVALYVGYVTFDDAEREGIIEVNERVADDVEAFFEVARELDFPFDNIAPASEYDWNDNLLMAENVTFGFNYRLIVGQARPSLHSQGLAFDVNQRQNPYIRMYKGNKIIAPEGAKWKIGAPGTLDGNHTLVKFMTGKGWEWGGNWRLKHGVVDYHHFQKRLD